MFKGGLLGYNIWLQLPSEIRHKLVTLFDMPRSGRTTVEYRATGAVVTSDGFTPEDLGAITLERMQGLLGSDSDNFYKLFEKVVTNIDALIDGSFDPKNEPVLSQLVDDKGEVVYESGFAPTHKQVEELTKKSTFCDQCDSKGGRHKKVCPKYNA